MHNVAKVHRRGRGGQASDLVRRAVEWHDANATTERAANAPAAATDAARAAARVATATVAPTTAAEPAPAVSVATSEPVAPASIAHTPPAVAIPAAAETVRTTSNAAASALRGLVR